jgi:cytochrome c
VRGIGLVRVPALTATFIICTLIDKEMVMKIRIATLSVAGALVLMSTGASAAIDDKNATEILNKGGCTACHAVDKKLVGPSYQEVAKKHKGKKDAAAVVAKKVRDGGTGTYGQIPMPPNAKDKVSDADLKALVDWVLSK